MIDSNSALNKPVQAVNIGPERTDWRFATIGRHPLDKVRAELAGTPSLDKLTPMFLIASGAVWRTRGTAKKDLGFLVQQ